MILRRTLKISGRLSPWLLLLTVTLRSDSGVTGLLPAHLSETGLYADFARKRVARNNLMYSPQYPLWSDGATKRRWIYLPPGRTIDASHVDNWIFPVGTKIWKEFSFGKRVETRLLEKAAPADWIYASYVWNADESDAVLVPEKGLRDCADIAPGVCHNIPGVNDCKACHESPGREIVLGFNALQLSPDRDPNAPHAEPVTSRMVNLRTLAKLGRLFYLPSQYLKTPPKIDAPTPQARAALGDLWANCGGCHNASDPLASVGMFLRRPLEGEPEAGETELQTVIGHESTYQIPGMAAGQSYRIDPGDPAHSAIVYRMGTRNPFRQMPPLATKIVDKQALDLITRWIQEDLGNHREVRR